MVIEGTREPLPSTTSYSPYLLLDSENNYAQPGIHKGSIITKLKDGDKTNSIIISEKIAIAEDLSIEILEGLRVGMNGCQAIVEKSNFVKTKDEVLYSVKIDTKIVREFDKVRFDSSFPNMVAFENNKCLYHSSSTHPVNHIEFVREEILSHPIALIYPNSIVIADHVVIDHDGYPVFYNAFMVERTESSEELITITYEPVFRRNIHFCKWIIILGVEMLK